MSSYLYAIDNDIYPKVAVIATKEAFKDYLRVKVIPSDRGSVKVEVEVLPQYLSEEREIQLEFFNYLLDYTIQLLFER